jgi:hypothetical protein
VPRSTDDRTPIFLPAPPDPRYVAWFDPDEVDPEDSDADLLRLISTDSIIGFAMMPPPGTSGDWEPSPITVTGIIRPRLARYYGFAEEATGEAFAHIADRRAILQGEAEAAELAPDEG